MRDMAFPTVANSVGHSKVATSSFGCKKGPYILMLPATKASLFEAHCAQCLFGPSELGELFWQYAGLLDSV
jgi:hypothetical protein